MHEGPRFARSSLTDGTEVVTVRGDFEDVGSGPELGELLHDCVEARTHVALDLSDTDFIDSAGLSVLLHAQQQLADVGRRLVLVNPHKRIERILGMTGMDHVLETAPDPATARAQLTD